MELVSDTSWMVVLGVLFSQAAQEVCPVPLGSAAAFITVLYLILKVVTVTAICKRSFDMYNSFFFRYPIGFTCECLE